ncbi:uncharacterized protein EV422DRAFT_360750 [Fimicolochytrium jonesii]|uniref:uncharacterized protein n=1 Tax=Fimicolochytrium jonesii TaxID=1396493 RepID=UPI0022FEAEA2|nr:uncharacterized protein EV422DRAFT_360750 [Fimicolochytrium jonesii]KAI8823570.1 hypothetical protein EV422DRAFT_360750 [Fimicolochytrium jonesii]
MSQRGSPCTSDNDCAPTPGMPKCLKDGLGATVEVGQCVSQDVFNSPPPTATATPLPAKAGGSGPSAASVLTIVGAVVGCVLVLAGLLWIARMKQIFPFHYLRKRQDDDWEDKLNLSAVEMEAKGADRSTARQSRIGGPSGVQGRSTVGQRPELSAVVPSEIGVTGASNMRASPDLEDQGDAASEERGRGHGRRGSLTSHDDQSRASSAGRRSRRSSRASIASSFVPDYLHDLPPVPAMPTIVHNGPDSRVTAARLSTIFTAEQLEELQQQMQSSAPPLPTSAHTTRPSVVSPTSSTTSLSQLQNPSVRSLASEENRQSIRHSFFAFDNTYSGTLDKTTGLFLFDKPEESIDYYNKLSQQTILSQQKAAGTQQTSSGRKSIDEVREKRRKSKTRLPIDPSSQKQRRSRAEALPMSMTHANSSRSSLTKANLAKLDVASKPVTKPRRFETPTQGSSSSPTTSTSRSSSAALAPEKRKSTHESAGHPSRR